MGYMEQRVHRHRMAGTAILLCNYLIGNSQSKRRLHKQMLSLFLCLSVCLSLSLTVVCISGPGQFSCNVILKRYSGHIYKVGELSNGFNNTEIFHPAGSRRQAWEIWFNRRYDTIYDTIYNTI